MAVLTVMVEVADVPGATAAGVVAESVNVAPAVAAVTVTVAVLVAAA